MYWVNKENGRYYEAKLVRGLFDECTLQVSWGGKNKGGGGVSEVVGCEKAAKLRIKEIEKDRKAHGYQLIDKNL